MAVRAVQGARFAFIGAKRETLAEADGPGADFQRVEENKQPQSLAVLRGQLLCFFILILISPVDLAANLTPGEFRRVHVGISFAIPHGLQG